MFRRGLLIALLQGITQAGNAQQPALKDPMQPYRPPSAAQSVSGGWRLTSIVRSGERRVAVLNGKALREGDSINGAVVEAIEAWQVRLKRAEKSIVIPLRRSKVSSDTIQREAKP